MHPIQRTPYGTWKSPLSAADIVAGSVRFGNICWHEGNLYWTEGRPSEGGRNVLVRRDPDGVTTDLNPAPTNIRSRAHEYGGLSFSVSELGVLFSNDEDRGLHRIDAEGAISPICQVEGHHWADPIADARRQHWILVEESHPTDGSEAVARLVSISVDGTRTVLHEGHDFYASPALSSDGNSLSWITWSHPNLPWDATTLWVAAVDEDGSLDNVRAIDGGGHISVFQPQWLPDGSLLYAADPTDWWNLYLWRDGRSEPLWQAPVEMGLPQWVFGMSTAAPAANNTVVTAFVDQGLWKLAQISTDSRQVNILDLPFTLIHQVRTSGNKAAFVAGSPTQPRSMVVLDLESNQWEVIRRSSTLEMDPALISKAQPVTYPTSNNQKAHGFYYSPTHPQHMGDNGEAPPLLIFIHGGPTAATVAVLDPRIQYWTSRGFAILDVNYRGSTGYGRPYREALKGEWGKADVDDCAYGALFLAERGDADPNRLIIRGGSAGGYTTLAALTFTDVFKAGASYYGISDIQALDDDTHKFESQYTFGLVDPNPLTRSETYRSRSPIHHVDKIRCPVIFFQGLEDKVVPPAQAEVLVDALRNANIPVSYIPLEGEQHGFRKAENQRRCLELELAFYARVFGMNLPEDIEKPPIENAGALLPVDSP